MELVSCSSSLGESGQYILIQGSQVYQLLTFKGVVGGPKISSFFTHPWHTNAKPKRIETLYQILVQLCPSLSTPDVFIPNFYKLWCNDCSKMNLFWDKWERPKMNSLRDRGSNKQLKIKVKSYEYKTCFLPAWVSTPPYFRIISASIGRSSSPSPQRFGTLIHFSGFSCTFL